MTDTRPDTKPGQIQAYRMTRGRYEDIRDRYNRGDFEDAPLCVLLIIAELLAHAGVTIGDHEGDR